MISLISNYRYRYIYIIKAPSEIERKQMELWYFQFCLGQFLLVSHVPKLDNSMYIKVCKNSNMSKRALDGNAYS